MAPERASGSIYKQSLLYTFHLCVGTALSISAQKRGVATSPRWKLLDDEKGGTHALHMNEKNMLRNYSPKQLLHELTLVVMHIASPFLGLSDKAAR